MVLANNSFQGGMELNDGTDLGSGVKFLRGSSAPGGDAGEQDDAALGSLFFRTDTGAVLIKKTDTNATADWSDVGDTTIDELSWRNETVIAATGDTLTAGSGIDPTAWTDNEQGLDGDDIPNGSYVIGDVDGTPLLFQKTAQVSATSITLVAASQALADNDTFVVQNYLPDSPAAQEEQAIIHFPSASAAGVKIADFNWALADGITLNGLTPTTGGVSGTDTVQVATEKMEKGILDLVSLSGEARNATNFTAFASPASLLIDGTTATIKSAFQRIFDLYAQLRGVEVAGITAEANVDTVPHATVQSCVWLVEAFETATPANRRSAYIHALTDGTSVTHTTSSELKLGSGNIVTWNVDISGADMRLRASSGTAGITVTARRIEVVKNVL